jgi:hypothetical protein
MTENGAGMKVSYWTVIYSHRHGTDAWPMFAHQCDDPERGPDEDEVIAGLDDLYEPDRDDEWIEISGRQQIDIPTPDVSVMNETSAMEIDIKDAEYVKVFAQDDETHVWVEHGGNRYKLVLGEHGHESEPVIKETSHE